VVYVVFFAFKTIFTLCTFIFGVEALNAQVTHLLLELQNACATRSLSWATLKEIVIKNVNQSRRTRGGKRGVRDVRDLQMLLLQLKEVVSL
jgi:hypothetical protein